MRNVKVVKLKDASRYQRLLSAESGTKGIKAGHVILKPGEDIGVHSTARDIEEILVILKGKGDLILDKDAAKEIEEGRVAYISPDISHNVKNTGAGVLEYIFITSKC